MNEDKRQILGQFLEIMESIYLQAHAELPTKGFDADLTMPQFRTITFLTTGPHKVGEIAAHLGVSPSSATSVIDRLVNKGLVGRLHNSEDRRVIKCQLTPLGQIKMRRFWSVSTERLESAARNLSLEEIEVLVRALEALLTAICCQSRGGAPQQPDASLEEGGESA